MRVFDFEYFQEAVLSHHFKSGEIILLIYEYDKKKYNFESLIRHFFQVSNIETESSVFNVSRLEKFEAIESIKYGLKTKANYTCIEKEFTDSDKNRYSNEFIAFFENPEFYTIDTRIFKADLNLNDFWEVGGSIIVDDSKVGIFWINDLYDQFD